MNQDFLINQTEHLVLLSAFLGGFSATFLAAILVAGTSKRITNWIVCLSAISACSFIVSTISSIAFLNGLQPDSPVFDQQFSLSFVRAVSAFALLIGIFSLLSSIGLSGWIRSKKVGVVTSAVSLVAIAFVTLFF